MSNEANAINREQPRTKIIPTHSDTYSDPHAYPDSDSDADSGTFPVGGSHTYPHSHSYPTHSHHQCRLRRNHHRGCIKRESHQ